MPKPSKNKQIYCTHFVWRLINRRGTWYADGRSNTPSAGRHSLGTKDYQQALQVLPDLDRVRAEDLGLVPRSMADDSRGRLLSLEEGRKLYEQHTARSRVAGGTRESTHKRYRAIFDKFIPFAKSLGVTVWNGVTADLLTKYADHLEKKPYAPKTIFTELTMLKQAVKWMVAKEYLKGMKPIDLPLRKPQSQAAYCYRSEEVRAMIEHCRAEPSLEWLADVIVALACTGLRISELASLRWTDLGPESHRLTLSDETGRSHESGRRGRELKSGRGRSFPIHDDLLAVFEALPRRRGHVFRGPRGGRLKPDTLRRILARDVIEPLSQRFPTAEEERGFKDGRLHSFRHYSCSTCANNGVPERMVMDWLGHADSTMIRHYYYHHHDEEAQRRMNSLDFLGGAGGWSAGRAGDNQDEEDVGPTAESRGKGDGPD